MIRLTLAAAVVALIACGSPQKTPAPAPAPTTKPEVADPPRTASADPAAVPIGVYLEKHTVKMVCHKPDWCEEEVTDRLAIDHIDPDANEIRVDIDLIQTNAHTCGFRGTLRREGPSTWRHKSTEDHGSCDLTITWREPNVEVRSEGCRQWCGARAHLWADFSFPPAVDRYEPAKEY